MHLPTLRKILSIDPIWENFVDEALQKLNKFSFFQPAEIFLTQISRGEMRSSCSSWGLKEKQDLLNLFDSFIQDNFQNVSTDQKKTPLQNFTAIRDPHHFQRYLFNTLQQVKNEVESIQPCSTGEEILDVFNKVEATLWSLYMSLRLYKKVNPNSEIRKFALNYQEKIFSFVKLLFSHPSFYLIHKSIPADRLKEPYRKQLMNVLKNLRENYYFDNPHQKEMIDIDIQVEQLAEKSLTNSKAEVLLPPIEISREEIEGYYDTWKEIDEKFQKNGDKYIIPYDKFESLAAYSKSSKVREKFWRALESHQKCDEELTKSQSPTCRKEYGANEKIFFDIIQKSHEMAKLRGSPNLIALRAKKSILKSGEKTSGFFVEYSEEMVKRARLEYQWMKKLKQQEEPQSDGFGPWDYYYYKAKIKEKLNFNEKDVEPYFEYEGVKIRIFQIVETLFDIHIQKIQNGSFWADDVEGYEVFDKDRKKIGEFYLDLLEREGKSGGNRASHFPFQYGIAQIFYPYSAVVANFGKRNINAPIFINYKNARYLLHELTHALQSIFRGQHRWARDSMQVKERDFNEAPAISLEKFATTLEGIQLIATHYQTGESIPKNVAKKMFVAESFGDAFWGFNNRILQSRWWVQINRQSSLPAEKRSLKGLAYLRNQYHLFPLMFGFEKDFLTDSDHFKSSLDAYSHELGETVADALFEPFLEQCSPRHTASNSDCLLNKKVGRNFRDLILKMGYSDSANDLMRRFIGVEWDLEPLRRSEAEKRKWIKDVLGGLH